MRDTSSAILRKIRVNGRGWVFGPTDFRAIGSRAAIDQTLSRLHQAGLIRRLRRGIYDFPRVSQVVGPVPAAVDAVTGAISRRLKIKVQASGPTAANALGLSTQVPAQVVFLTDGPSRHLRVGGQSVQFRHVAPSRLFGAGTPVGDVIQAVHYLGADRAKNLSRQLTHSLTPTVRRQLLQAIPHVPGWMQPILDGIAAPAAS